MITGLFTEEKRGLGDCWEDSVDLDKTLIERNKCPKCTQNLAYKGFSNINSYFAFGICEPCEYAKVFWTNSKTVANLKKRFSKARVQTV